VDIVCASLEKDGLKRDALNLGFSEAAQQKISAMTQASIGQDVETRICGGFHGAPKVMTPLKGDRVTIGQITATEAKCLRQGIKKHHWLKCAEVVNPAQNPAVNGPRE
jgi:preprotein translocase subunit SecD